MVTSGLWKELFRTVLIEDPEDPDRRHKLSVNHAESYTHCTG
jgi:hypothetical protein